MTRPRLPPRPPRESPQRFPLQLRAAASRARQWPCPVHRERPTACRPDVVLDRRRRLRAFSEASRLQGEAEAISRPFVRTAGPSRPTSNTSHPLHRTR